jgi:hypothetical protein
MARKTVPKRKRQRIGRGRPPNESDQIIIDMAAALMEVSTLGPQQARDLALALLEGHLTTPKNLPRGYRRMPKSSILTARELPVTFKGREGNVADKVRLARFRQINLDNPVIHHDALEFPDGQVVLVTRLCAGQRATVLQLPAGTRAATTEHAVVKPQLRESSLSL